MGNRKETLTESTVFDYYLDRGLYIIGTKRPYVYFNDFETPVGIYAVSGGGFAAANTGVQSNVGSAGPSIYQLTSGTTAASTATYNPDAAIAANPLTKKFYMAARGKITTVPDAQAVAVWGLQDDGTDSLTFGSIGADSTTQFSFQYNGALGAGSNVALGVALDTSFHVFEMWGLGDGNIYCRMDAASSVVKSALETTAMGHGELFMRAGNGSTAAAQTTQTDWVIVVSER